MHRCCTITITALCICPTTHCTAAALFHPRRTALPPRLHCHRDCTATAKLHCHRDCTATATALPPRLLSASILQVFGAVNTDWPTIFKKENRRGNTLLMCASCGGHAELARQLVQVNENYY